MKKRKRLKKTISQFAKKHRFIIISLIMLLTPLIIGAIYALPYPQVIQVDSGDLLSYYGTAFGIFGSFYTYFFEKKKEKLQEKEDLRPSFIVRLKKVSAYKNRFTLEIIPDKNKVLKYVDLYDTQLEDLIETHYTKTICFCENIISDIQDSTVLPLLNQTDILDSDGFPKYLSFIVADQKSNSWDCTFVKVGLGSDMTYLPREFVIRY